MLPSAGQLSWQRFVHACSTGTCSRPKASHDAVPMRDAPEIHVRSPRFAAARDPSPCHHSQTTYIHIRCPVALPCPSHNGEYFSWSSHVKERQLGSSSAVLTACHQLSERQTTPTNSWPEIINQTRDKTNRKSLRVLFYHTRTFALLQSRCRNPSLLFSNSPRRESLKTWPDQASGGFAGTTSSLQELDICWLRQFAWRASC